MIIGVIFRQRVVVRNFQQFLDVSRLKTPVSPGIVKRGEETKIQPSNTRGLLNGRQHGNHGIPPSALL